VRRGILLADGTVPVGESISFGWRKTMDHIWSWIYAVIIGGLIGWIPIVGSLIHAGFIRITLNVSDGEKPDAMDLFGEVDKWVRVFFGSILYGLIVLGGLILLIVPGIYWAIKYFFFFYYIVDKDMGTMESLRASGELTNGHKWSLLWLWIVLILINMLGAILCLVGLLVTIPLTLMATVYVYHALQGAAPAAGSPEA
jgi:uncharacterized membrane protein